MCIERVVESFVVDSVCGENVFMEVVEGVKLEAFWQNNPLFVKLQNICARI